MKPVEFNEQTNVLRAPDCNDLPVFSNGEVVISKWVPTDEEIELIKQGEGIYLLVQSGLTSPPVNLFVGNPFLHEPSENT